MLAFDYEVITMSSLSPIVILNVNSFTSEVLSELNRITLHDSVKVLFKYIEEIPMYTFSSGFEFEGDTGDGGGSNPPNPNRKVITVGIVDWFLPVYEGSCEYHHTSNPFHFRSSGAGHEASVAHVLTQNFDDQQYLNVCYASARESITIENAINGLANMDVDIIIIAIGESYDAYDHTSYHMDYVSWNSGVTFVSSVGNQGLVSNGGDSLVASTATSYNGVSVGGIAQDHSFWEGSSYIYNDYEINKPNVVDFVEFPSGAPGTSFSAPRVAAKIAMFLSYYPEYRRDHIALLSFIHASALKSQINVSNNILHSSGLTDKLGAGMLDFDRLYDIATYNDYHRIMPFENPASLPLDLFSFHIHIPLNHKVQISLSSFYADCHGGDFGDRTEYDLMLLDDESNVLKSIVSQSNILHLTYDNNLAYGLFDVLVRQKTPNVCHGDHSEIVVSYTIIPIWGREND